MYCVPWTSQGGEAAPADVLDRIKLLDYPWAAEANAGAAEALRCKLHLILDSSAR